MAAGRAGFQLAFPLPLLPGLTATCPRLLDWDPCATVRCVITQQSAGSVDRSVQWLADQGFVYITTAVSYQPFGLWEPCSFRVRRVRAENVLVPNSRPGACGGCPPPARFRLRGSARRSDLFERTLACSGLKR